MACAAGTSLIWVIKCIGGVKRRELIPHPKRDKFPPF